MAEKDHWEGVYERKQPEDVSWYRPHLERSMEFIRAAGLKRDAHIIDVGGGTSTLADDLLDQGYSKVSVLDISSAAIEKAKIRLGSRAHGIQWIVADITQAKLPEHYFDFWHDRAVFHFLTTEDERRRYVEAVCHSLKPNGHVVVATFGLEGPEKCSGLDVIRYSSDSLHAQFGKTFKKVASAAEVHVTPWGTEQEFVYCYCRMSV